MPPYIDVFAAVVRDNQVAQVAVMAVLLLILLDIVFGVGDALFRHVFSSEKMRAGIGHKCSEMGFLLVGVIVDGTISAGFDLGFTAPVFVAICAYLCVMEIGSLLEIFGKMNPQLANSPVLKVLESTKFTGGGEDECAAD